MGSSVEGRREQDARDKRKGAPHPVGPSTWDLTARPRRGARFARKTVSTPRGPALTQVGRAPSLMLEAPTVSSPLKSSALGLCSTAGLECPEASPGLGKDQTGRGDKHSLARGKVSPGAVEWREKSVPWALALGREPRLPSRQYLPSLEHRRALPGPLPVCRQHLSLTQVEPADSI